MHHRNVVCFLFLVIALSCSFARADPLQESTPDSRLGYWIDSEGTLALLLESERSGWLDDGRPRFYRTSYSPSGAVFESWGTKTKYQLRMEGKALRVVGGDRNLLLKRTETIPSALLVSSYELPADVEVDGDVVAELSEDLAQRRIADQRVRGANGGSLDPGGMQRVDADNTEFLQAILSEFGWIDAVRFGVAASDAAFLIVQHTGDLRLMRTALPFIELDVRAGRIGGQNYALLFDRLQLSLGYKQRYGSQIGIADGEQLLMPCEDIHRVDEFRAEMGMGKLSEYLALFAEGAGSPEIPHLGEGKYDEN